MEPFDLGAIRRALHDWLHAQTGLQVAWSHQNARPPRLPFASLSIVSGPQAVTPRDEQSVVDVLSILHFAVARGPRLLTVSCQTYARPYEDGKTAMDYLVRAQASLQRPSVRAALGAAGIVVLEDMGINEAPDIVCKSWRSRAHMDVRLAITSTISELTDVIESVPVSGGSLE